MLKWPTNNPNFYKVKKRENLIEISNQLNLQADFYEYALSFKDAGRTIANYIAESSNIRELDVYFFSVAYLYRHSLELILKGIAFKYIVGLEERKAFLNETSHDLILILDKITPYLKEIISHNTKAYRWIKLLITDMCKFDKASDSFRYPFAIEVNKDSNEWGYRKKLVTKPFFYKQTSINLVTFVNKMEIAFDIFKSYFEEKGYENNIFEKYNTIFLEEGGNYYNTSVIGYSYNRMQFSTYVNSYIETANYLHKHMLECKTNYFIPMCYLYRNGIELIIKEILFEECSYNTENALEIINKKKHSIEGLWKCIEQEIMKHAQAPEDDETISNVNKYIKVLHDLDAQSDKFRYPINKGFDFHFKKRKKFDLEIVTDFFEELFNFLSSASLMMNTNNELLAEMKKEAME